MMLSHLPTCLWCGKPFNSRRGGSRQAFCCPRHRISFHTSARRWAERAIAIGILTIADLQDGDPAACTLFSGGFSPRQVPDTAKHIFAAPRRSEVISGLALDEMMGKQVRELIWGDPYHRAS